MKKLSDSNKILTLVFILSTIICLLLYFFIIYITEIASIKKYNSELENYEKEFYEYDLKYNAELKRIEDKLYKNKIKTVKQNIKNLIVRTYTSKLLTYLENYEANRAIYMIFIKNDLIDQILLNVDSKNMIFKGYITNNFKLFISSKLKNIYFIDQLDQILSTNKNIIIYSDFSNQIYLNKLLKNKVKIIFKNFADPKISNDKIEKKFDYFFNKKVLILGGAGSIGSGILNKLLEYNCNKIVIADISEINIFNIKNSYSFDSNVQFRLCDCTDYTSLSNIIDEYDIDIIFHCAANKHVLISENSHQHVLFNNIMSTINLIKIIKNNKKIMKLTYISTDKAVEPSNIMGLSKRIGEIFIKIEKLKSSNLRERINIVRFGNVIGSSGSLIPTYRDLIIKDKPLIVYGLKTRRFFMSLNEAVFLTIFSNSIYTKANEVLFFDMGEDIQIYDVAKKILNIYKPESSTEGKKFIKIKKLNKSEKVAEKLHYKSDKITNFEYESIKIVDESNSYDYKKLSLVYKNFSKKDFYFKKIDTKLLKDLYKMVSMN